MPPSFRKKFLPYKACYIHFILFWQKLQDVYLKNIKNLLKKFYICIFIAPPAKPYHIFAVFLPQIYWQVLIGGAIQYIRKIL